jgi:hypothetical protein
MSKIVFVIDLPSLCKFPKNILVQKLMEELPGLRHTCIFANEDLLTLVYEKCDGYNTYDFDLFMTNVEFSKYDKKTIEGLTIQPNLYCGDKQIDEEVDCQCGAMHTKLTSMNHQYLTFANRWGSCHGTPVITTAIRGKNRLHNVIIFSNENDVVHFKEKFEPHLLQLKHDNIPTHIGTEDVAPFTLWNKNDEGPAQRLLKKAFDDSDDKDLFPHVLYGWDAKNGVWVKFNHNGASRGDDINRDYHGYDLRNNELNQIPKNLKSKYNHWTNDKKDWQYKKKSKKKKSATKKTNR